MDWLATLETPDGAPLFRTADGQWVGQAADAERVSDAERAATVIPVDNGLARWAWTPALPIWPEKVGFRVKTSDFAPK